MKRYAAIISIDQYRAISALLDRSYTIEAEPLPSTSIAIHCETEADFETFKDLMHVLAVERPELFRIG